MPVAQSQPFRRGFVASLLVAIVGGVVCAAFAWKEPPILWRAYTLAWFSVWPIAMGSLGMIALGNLTGGRWAAAARPFYLAAAGTVPFLAVLFIPIAFGLDHVYPWASHTGTEGAFHFSQSKATYLSPPFFLTRSALYFLVWLICAWWLGNVSRLDRPPASRPAMRRAGAASLVILLPTTTFAAYDWGMSLEPHWYSSIYGATIIAGGVVAVHALAVISLALASPELRRAVFVARPHGGENETLHFAKLFNDLGNLLLAFIMVWTYFSLSQFLIIWSANLPSEIVWYERRLSDGWGIVALAIVAICFAAPFLVLLSRDLKRTPARLSVVAALVAVGYFLNMYWTIVPAFPPEPLVGQLANIAAMTALAGVWLAFYWWGLGRLAGRRASAREQAL